MLDSSKEKIIQTIIQRESLRSLSRFKRFLADPIRTTPFYFLTTLSHIKPFKISFKTLWQTNMTSYLPEGNTFYYYGFCEANLTNFLLRFLKKNDIFVDVGAHIGFYSLLASEILGDFGRVYSFEPTPTTFNLLKENSETLNNIILFNMALSDKKGEITFSDYGPGYGAYNSGHEKGAVALNKKSKTIVVKTEILDNILDKEKIEPDLIKLDAEGLEYKILQGMNNLFLKQNRPIITLEVAGGLGWKENYDKSIQFLLNKNYQVYEIKTDGFIFPHIIKKEYEYENLLFIPKEKKEALKYLLHDHN